MNITINTTRLELTQGDITKQTVDAIINSAGPDWHESGGVDATIRRAGGPDIAAECRRRVEGCSAGKALMTSAGALPASYVIHAFGPHYRDGVSGEAELLASIYRNSLRVAAEHHLHSIAFPSIATEFAVIPPMRPYPLRSRPSSIFSGMSRTI